MRASGRPYIRRPLSARLRPETQIGLFCPAWAAYAQTGQLTMDPYSGLGENTVRIRLEANILYHVLDASAAYFVSS